MNINNSFSFPAHIFSSIHEKMWSGLTSQQKMIGTIAVVAFAASSLIYVVFRHLKNQVFALQVQNKNLLDRIGLVEGEMRRGAGVPLTTPLTIPLVPMDNERILELERQLRELDEKYRQLSTYLTNGGVELNRQVGELTEEWNTLLASTRLSEDRERKERLEGQFNELSQKYEVLAAQVSVTNTGNGPIIELERNVRELAEKCIHLEDVFQSEGEKRDELDKRLEKLTETSNFLFYKVEDYAFVNQLMRRIFNDNVLDGTVANALIERFEQALAIDPRNTAILTEYAILQIQCDKIDEAFGFLERALAVSPVDPTAMGIYLTMIVLQGRWNEFQMIRERAMAIPELQAIYVELLFFIKDWDAIRSLLSTFRGWGYCKVAISYEVELAIMDHQWDEAFLKLISFMGKSPNLSWEFIRYAQILKAKGREEEGKRLFEQLSDLDPQNDLERYWHGAVLYELGDKEEAKKQFVHVMNGNLVDEFELTPDLMPASLLLRFRQLFALRLRRNYAELFE